MSIVIPPACLGFCRTVEERQEAGQTASWCALLAQGLHINPLNRTPHLVLTVQDWQHWRRAAQPRAGGGFLAHVDNQILHRPTQLAARSAGPAAAAAAGG